MEFFQTDSYRPNDFNIRSQASVLNPELKASVGVLEVDRRKSFWNQFALEIIKLSKRNKKDVLEIITKGVFHGLAIPEQLYTVSKFKPEDTLVARMMLALIYNKNALLAKSIVDNFVGMAHGTSSSALIGIEPYGLLSRNQITDNKIIILSGETSNGSVFNGINLNAVSTAPYYSSAAYDYATRFSHLKAWNIYDKIKKLNKLIEGSDDLYDNYRTRAILNNRKVVYENYKSSIKYNVSESPLEKLLIADNYPVVFLIEEKPVENTKLVAPQNNHINETGFVDGVSKDTLKIMLVPRQYYQLTQRWLVLKNWKIDLFYLEDYNRFEQYESIEKDILEKQFPSK